MNVLFVNFVVFSLQIFDGSLVCKCALIFIFVLGCLVVLIHLCFSSLRTRFFFSYI